MSHDIEDEIDEITRDEDEAEEEKTFKNPNKNIIKSKLKAKIKNPLLDEDQIDLHNKEVTDNPKEYVRVKSIFTEPDVDPVNPELDEKDRQFILNFGGNDYQNELSKEQNQRLAYMIWQSKQLYYTAFRRVGVDKQTKQVEWEQRDYKYHMIQNDTHMEIVRLEAELSTLETKFKLWNNGIVNDALYRDMIVRTKPIVVDIEELKDKILKRKFKAYFLEDNEQILDSMNQVDLRDLVAAAKYREEGVPFSRKRVSYPSTSGSSVAKVNLKS